jgi:hypothetical protein
MSIITNGGFDTTTNKDFSKAGILRNVFDNTDTKPLVYYKKLVNDVSTKDEWERDARMAGFTAFSSLVEGQGIPIQGIPSPQTKQYTQKRYGTGFRMTAWADYFNKYELWKRMSRNLKKVMAESVDIEVHKMFNNPTSSTYQGTGFDSVVLAHATHTGLLAGSTSDNYSNLLSVAPSYTALASLKYYFDTIINDMGMLMKLDPELIVFQPTLWPTWKEILGSENIAFEISNTKSPWKDYLEPVSDPRLTSTTAWFVESKKDDNFDINVFTSKDPDFAVKDAPDTSRDKIATSETYFTYGFGSAKGILWGNT